MSTEAEYRISTLALPRNDFRRDVLVSSGGYVFALNIDSLDCSDFPPGRTLNVGGPCNQMCPAGIILGIDGWISQEEGAVFFTVTQDRQVHKYSLPSGGCEVVTTGAVFQGTTGSVFSGASHTYAQKSKPDVDMDYSTLSRRDLIANVILFGFFLSAVDSSTE